MATIDITYGELKAGFRKGLRNGNWRKLNFLGRALYRAALWYAKQRSKRDGNGNIVNASLVKKLSELIEKLKERRDMRIFKRGLGKAVKFLKKYEENDVFTWAPQLKGWLKDPAYIFWLGTMR